MLRRNKDATAATADLGDRTEAELALDGAAESLPEPALVSAAGLIEEHAALGRPGGPPRGLR